MKKFYSILVVLMAAIAFSYAALPSQQVQFEEALAMEEVQGNLQEAIVLYQKIVADNGGNRAIAAKALFRLGGCYEKLGQDVAWVTYEQLIAEYPDQQEEVRMAQAKLDAMGAESQQTAGVTIRKLVLDDENSIWAWNVSADGRFLGAANYATGKATIVDLVAGKHWDVTDYGTLAASTQGMPMLFLTSISPDGRNLAFEYDWIETIRVIGSDGTGEKVLLEHDKIQSPRGWVFPSNWSRDGRYLAVLGNFKPNPDSVGDLLYMPGTHNVALVPIDGGEVRFLKLPEFALSEFAFSPDGRFLAYDSRRVDTEQTDVHVVPVSGGQEMDIVTHPANDKFIGWVPNGDILFTSDRTGTSALYSVAVEDGKQSGEPQLLQDNIGNITDPLGITDAGSLYYANIRMVFNSFFASIDLSTGRLLSETEEISDRLSDVTLMPSWSQDGRYLSYLLNRPTAAKPTVMIREIASGEERELVPDVVLLPAFRNRIRWHPDGKSLLALGYKDDQPGLLRIDAATGEVSLVFPVGQRLFNNSMNGGNFLEWSPDAKWFFTNGAPIVHKIPSIIRRNLETGEEQVIYSYEPEMRMGSVFHSLRVSPDGKSLAFVQKLAEERYALRVVPTSGGEYRELFTGPMIVNQNLSIAWTNDSRHILFVNEENKNQWTWRIWIVPAEGGEARATEIYGSGNIASINFDPNSDRLAFSTVRRMREHWVMENFLPSK